MSIENLVDRQRCVLTHGRPAKSGLSKPNAIAVTVADTAEVQRRATPRGPAAGVSWR